MLRFVLLSLTHSGASLFASDQPNVITDDQGDGDLSCHGNPMLKTPNLDALHAESVRLSDHHVSPTCGPTRAALMTGHFSNRTGVWHPNCELTRSSQLDSNSNASLGSDVFLNLPWHM